MATTSLARARIAEIASPQPDEIGLDLGIQIARGADELARAELAPLDATERRALGDLLLAARMLTGQDLSRAAALRLLVNLTRRVALGVSQRRGDDLQAELDAERVGERS